MLQFPAIPRWDALQPLVIHSPVEKKHGFDPNIFLATIGEGRKSVLFPKKQTIFAQGDPSDAVFYIQNGKVKLTVVSKTGKEATIGILGDGEFLGESCLAGQSLRMESAIAISDCTVLRIEKQQMLQSLHREHAFSAMFVDHLLHETSRYEADLVDQLFQLQREETARILLLLAHFGKEGAPRSVVPTVSQETLAEMVGTTRSRVSFFMNRFRRLGFVDYDSRNGLQVHSSLLQYRSPGGRLNPMNTIEQTRQSEGLFRVSGLWVRDVADGRFQNVRRVSQVRESQLATGPSKGRPLLRT